MERPPACLKDLDAGQPGNSGPRNGFTQLRSTGAGAARSSSPRIGQERLMPIGPVRNRVADLDSLRPQLRDDRIEVLEEQGEVLALALRRWEPEEMDLLASGSDSSQAPAKPISGRSMFCTRPRTLV